MCLQAISSFTVQVTYTQVRFNTALICFEIVMPPGDRVTIYQSENKEALFQDNIRNRCEKYISRYF